jgi:phage gp45-like
MVVRTTVSQTNLKARSNSSRASVREIDDKHLMQQVKKADVFHSETPSDFERWQMAGITAVPMKQEEKNDQKQSKSGDESGADWNHDQPQGKSAEALMLYLNGDRNHPVGLVDDRRVRPYNMKEGETALYSVSGTGQMVLHTDDGTYIVAVDNPPEQSKEDAEDKERIVSLRHVKKDKQKREIKEGEEPEDHVHEGKADQVNTEVRASAKKIEILDGEDIIAVYSKEDKSWTFSNFKKLTLEPSEEFNVNTKKINLQASDSMKVQTPGEFKLDGHPLLVNGGGPVLDPFTVP